jgi:hypothetical protein
MAEKLGIKVEEDKIEGGNDAEAETKTNGSEDNDPSEPATEKHKLDHNGEQKRGECVKFTNKDDMKLIPAIKWEKSEGDDEREIWIEK